MTDIYCSRCRTHPKRKTLNNGLCIRCHTSDEEQKAIFDAKDQLLDASVKLHNSDALYFQRTLEMDSIKDNRLAEMQNYVTQMIEAHKEEIKSLELLHNERLTDLKESLFDMTQRAEDATALADKYYNQLQLCARPDNVHSDLLATIETKTDQLNKLQQEDRSAAQSPANTPRDLSNKKSPQVNHTRSSELREKIAKLKKK